MGLRYTRQFLIQRMQFVRAAERMKKERFRIEEGLPPIPPNAADQRGERSYATVFKSGDTYEVYEYQRPVMLGRSRGGRSADGEKSEREEENRTLSIKRAKRNIRRLVNANFDRGSKFVTLTFSDTAALKSGPPIDIRNIEDTNKAFKQFIQRLRRYAEKLGYGEFKYLAVIEFQDKTRNGVVHYHVILDVPYIKHEILAEIWGMGFIGINLIDNCDNIGAYLVKYLMKDLGEVRLRGKKAYLVSKGLTRPEKISGELAHRIVQDLEREDKKNQVYHAAYPSEYLGTITYKQYNTDQNKVYRAKRRQNLLKQKTEQHI